ncbi:hypothetical protein BKA63DRAFT_586192, partial [Paraphoma chrysanthemicola]
MPVHHNPDDDHGAGQNLWPLFRTISQRPDLGQKVRSLDLTVIKNDLSPVEVDSRIILPGGNPFTTQLVIGMYQEPIAACLLHHLNELKFLEFYCISSWASGYRTPSEDCLIELFPGFDPRTAHSVEIPGLQKLKKLEWHGGQFHWCLARFPNLTDVYIAENCELLPDEAPEQFNTMVKRMKVDNRSSHLVPHAIRHDTLKPMFAHFPSLGDLTIDIFDKDSHVNTGSYGDESFDITH